LFAAGTDLTFSLLLCRRTYAVQDFRNLKVWQAAHALTLDIYTWTKSFPVDERFGLTSQLRRAASSIEANLAEGCGRGSDDDFARFVQIATGSASELQCHLILAYDLGYLEPDSLHNLDDQSHRVKKMLVSLLQKLKEPLKSYKATTKNGI
jgi:four helix bundle protein